MESGLPDDLIGLGDAARLLPGRADGKRVCTRTLYRWIQRGKLPAWRVGRVYYASRSDVLALVKAVATKAVPELPSAAARTEAHRRAEEKLRKARFM